VGPLVRVIATLVLCAWLTSLLLSCSSQNSDAPQPVSVTVCSSPTADEQRIKADFGIHFDVPEKVFTVDAGIRDMPPGTLFVVKLREGEARMVIWHHDDGVFRDLENAYPMFSKHSEKRIIRDTAGRSFGTDRWGYLHTGERWRYVTFSTGDAVGYKPSSPRAANVLDQVINSACFPRN
jgi:hypothetical protein